MDDTQQHRVSDAASKRKRRSSILKSQRPPRAPFSELEFNVATPTDSAKSRRVSFSRRTGVAEFITNEATTTWKNLYEEHNKSLESSGIGPEVNRSRPSVCQLGKRIFDYQFQETEAVELAFTMQDGRGPESSTSFKFDPLNLDYTENDQKLSAPRQNIEFSTFTVSEQPSKLFSDRLAMSDVGEVSNKLDLDFSTMQPVECDDLNEIQKDIGRRANDNANVQNFVCAGPNDGRNVSEYIEFVDLNVTHLAVGGVSENSDDMSITETVHSPRVNVSKNNISDHTNKDWVADKENIIVNPYVAPKESNTFAINEETDKVLVFDGKRLTIQSEKEPIIDYRKTLLPNAQPDETPKRKTIVLNVDDDLPNFVDNPHTSITRISQYSTQNIFDKSVLDHDLDMTQPISANIKANNCDKSRMSMYDSFGNISMTQALPTNILAENTKRKTIVFDNDTADLSVTQAVPTNIIIEKHLTAKKSQALPIGVEHHNSEKRITIVFNNDMADISVTQAVPTDIIFEKHVSDKENRALPTGIEHQNTNKRRTIVFDNDTADISVTQAVPANIIYEKCYHEDGNLTSPEKVSEKSKNRRTIVFDCDTADISVTQAVSSNVMFVQESPEKRKTIVFEDEAGNISITQTLPTNLVNTESSQVKPFTRTIVYEPDTRKISVTEVTPTVPSKKNAIEKRQTIVFNDEENISFTQTMPANIIASNTSPNSKLKDMPSNGTYSNFSTYPSFEKSVANEADNFNISMTQALPTNIYFSERENFAVNNMSITEAVPTNLVSSESTVNKRKTLVFEDCDISMTEALPANVILAEKYKTENKAVVDESEFGDISITQAIPTKIIDGRTETSIKQKTEIYDSDISDISLTQEVSADILLSGKERRENEFDCDCSPGSSNSTLTLPIEKFDPNEADILVTKSEELFKSISLNDMATIEKNDLSLNKSVINTLNTLQTIKKVINPIPQDLISLQKDILDKTNIKHVSPKLQDMAVYQTSITSENQAAPLSAIPAPEVEIEPVHDPSATSDAKSIRSTEELQPDLSIEDIDKEELIEHINMNSILDSAHDAYENPTLAPLLEYDGSDECYVCPTLPTVLETEESKESIISSGALQRPSTVLKKQENIENKVLNDLLNMSDTLVNKYAILSDMVVKSGVDDKALTELPSEDTESSSSMFLIIKDSNETHPENAKGEVEMQSENTKGEKEVLENPEEQNSTTKELPQTGVVLRSVFEDSILDLEKKILDSHKKEAPPQNRHFEKVVSSKLKDVSSFDNTESLLEMLSQFTEKEEEENPIQPLGKETMRTAIHSQPLVVNREDASNSLSAQKLEQKKTAIKPTITTNKSPERQKTSRKSPELQKTSSPKKSSSLIKSSSSLIKSSSSLIKSSSSLIKKSSVMETPKTVEQPQPLVVNREDASNSLSAQKLEQNKTAIKPKMTTNKSPERQKTSRKSPELQKTSSPKKASSLIKKSSSIIETPKTVEYPNTVETPKTVEYPNTVETLKTVEYPNTVETPKTVESPNAVETPKTVDNLQQVSKTSASTLVSITMVDHSLSACRLPMSSSFIDKPALADKTSDVVKTLRYDNDYDDESTSDATTDVCMSPLRKTAFGKTSCIDEEKHKAYVIPPYLKDVSEDLKELMSDLVKPMADTLPFDSGISKRNPKNAAPKKCAEIQANLITSSQIDLDPERESYSESDIEASQKLNPESVLSLAAKKLKGIIKSSDVYLRPTVKLRTQFSDPSAPNTMDSSSDVPYSESPSDRSFNADKTWRMSEAVAIDQSVPGRPIVFDPTNPLNNVLIAPINFQEAHEYVPLPSPPPPPSPPPLPNLPPQPSPPPQDIKTDTKSGSVMKLEQVKGGKPIQVTFKDVEVDSIASYYLKSVIPNFAQQTSETAFKQSIGLHNTIAEEDKPQSKISITQTSDTAAKKSSQENSNISNNSKPITADQSVWTQQITKTIEVNTAIAMQDSRKLLEDNSSLTLFEDINVELSSSASKRGSPLLSGSGSSPIEVIYQQGSDKLDSDLGSEEDVKQCTKKRKRWIKDKHKNSALDESPKPAYKIRKHSFKNKSPKNLLDDETTKSKKGKKKSSPKDSPEGSPKGSVSSKDSPIKKERKSSLKRLFSPKSKTTTGFIVQQVITDFAITTQETNKHCRYTDGDSIVKKSRPEANSLSSCSRGDVNSISPSQMVQNRIIPMDWQPELLNEPSSKNLVAERESSVDVVHAIKTMPFMGTKECEWESSSGEQWAFRLLNGRLKLCVNLTPRRDADVRGRVRADTRVSGVTLETTPLVKKNAAAVLCVRFAAVAMRRFIALGCHRAGDVPALLRRCAGLSRVALRWGRAMFEAWVQLAYKLNEDGVLSMNVANLNLRSVWEITMRIELSTVDARDIPWPKANDVRVKAVVADTDISADEVRKVVEGVSGDWGHAPRTLWKIFSHLKNKTKGDEMLLGL